MKQPYPQKDGLVYEKPELKLQRLCGYDDESLLREAERARRQAEADRAADPEKAAVLEAHVRGQLEVLKARVSAEGMRPMTERRYRWEHRFGNIGVGKIRRKGKKRILALVAAVVLVLGGGLATTAKNQYKLVTCLMPGNQNGIFRFNTAAEHREDSLEAAYDAIEDELHIPVMTINYMPDGICFKSFTIADKQAVIELELNGQSLYLRQFSGKDQNHLDFTGTDRREDKKVDNFWLGTPVSVQKNILENGEVEYDAFVLIGDGYYFVEGILDESDFDKIVESMILR